MFKCEVSKIVYFKTSQETSVIYKIGDKGNDKIPNHRILNMEDNRFFLIGQVDKSIKVGDLLRCDGLPYMTKPVRSVNSKYSTDSCGRTIRTRYVYELPAGYTPFQLDSGYWVLRKDEHSKKK